MSEHVALAAHQAQLYCALQAAYEDLHQTREEREPNLSTQGRGQLQTIQRAPRTIIVMLTGWGQRFVADGDTPLHVDTVLSKPPKLRELREALARCLHAAQP